MALTVQSIANDTNVACRDYFGASSSNVDLTDAARLTRFLSWVNQIHKDVLHTSIWRTQLLTSETFTSEPDGSPYILTANNIRHIVAVHDLKNRRTLIPHESLTFPAGTAYPIERDGKATPKFDVTQQTSALYPQYYIFESCLLGADGITQGLHLLPDPVDAAHSGTIRYYYTKMVEDLDTATATLLIPEDGRDILVAGTAMLASQWLKRPSEAEMFRARYEMMKKGF